MNEYINGLEVRRFRELLDCQLRKIEQQAVICGFEVRIHVEGRPEVRIVFGSCRGEEDGEQKSLPVGLDHYNGHQF